MQQHDRQSLCVQACHGIPDAYLERGADGLWDWFQRHPLQGKVDDHDTWMPLDKLRRYLTQARSRRAIYAWVKLGISNRRGKVVRLHAEKHDGVLCTTLREYHLLNLRCDPASIATLKPGTYLALCHACDATKEFNANPHSTDPKTTLSQHGWQKSINGWQCPNCKTCELTGN